MEWVAREGTRKSQEGEMKWAGEFFEWAKTARAGPSGRSIGSLGLRIRRNLEMRMVPVATSACV